MDLINEFLLFFKMDYTQSVFIKETNLAQNISRDKLVKNLALKENIDPDRPVLMHIVTQYLKGMMGGMPPTGFQAPANNNKKTNELENNKKKNVVEPVEEKINNLFTKKREASPVIFFIFLKRKKKNCFFEGGNKKREKK